MSNFTWGGWAVGQAALRGALMLPVGVEECFTRSDIVSATQTPTQSSVRLTYWTAVNGGAFNNHITQTGATAQTLATLCKVGVYSVAANGDITLLASSASDTNLWAAPSTLYTTPYTSTATLSRGSLYATGILVVTAGTVQNMTAGTNAPLGAVTALSPMLSGAVAGMSDLPTFVAAGSIAATNQRIWSRLT